MKKKILLSRPYSWITIVLIAIISNVLAKEYLLLNTDLFFDIFISLLMWFSGMSILEYMHHRYEYKKDYNNIITLLIISILILTAFFRNIFSLIVLLFFFINTILYSMKTKGKLGSVSFLFRGFCEISPILIIFSFYNRLAYNYVSFIFIVSVYFLTLARNIIGDLRDVKIDEYTLATKYYDMNFVLSILFSVVPLIFFQKLGMSLVPVVIVIILTLLYAKKNSYLLHRIFVICTLFFLTNYLFHLLGVNLLITNILFLGILLNFTYDFVPRKLEILK